MENIEKTESQGLTLKNGAAKHLEGFLAEITKTVRAGLTKEQVEEICLNMIAAACIPSETRISLDYQGSEITIEEKQHYLFPLVAKLVNIPGINLVLTGPAGSGKTQMLLNIAKALGLEFVLQPFHAQLSKSELLGYVDANGRYVESAFYKAFSRGLFYIADEFDCANPSLATVINSAIANRVLTFPNGETVEAHKDFKFCACMNTVGLGANSRYVGRNRLDAATLDRFIMLEVPYDDSLESSFFGIIKSQQELNLDSDRLDTLEDVYKFVCSVRDYFISQAWDTIISPRAFIYAKKLSEAGLGRAWIIETVLCRGLNETQKQSLKSFALQ